MSLAELPAVLYFVSVYFMVDFEAAKPGMRGMREDDCIGMIWELGLRDKSRPPELSLQGGANSLRLNKAAMKVIGGATANSD